MLLLSHLQRGGVHQTSFEPSWPTVNSPSGEWGQGTILGLINLITARILLTQRDHFDHYLVTTQHAMLGFDHWVSVKSFSDSVSFCIALPNLLDEVMKWIESGQTMAKSCSDTGRNPGPKLPKPPGRGPGPALGPGGHGEKICSCLPLNQ